MLPKKTTLAIVTFGALLLMLQLANFARPFAPAAVIDFRPRSNAVLEAPSVRQARPVTRAKTVPLAPNLIDEHDNLKAFYQALWRTESRQPGAVTRILHYGDSPVTADSITADVRSLMQQQFGDAGHGFVLVAKPWAWYGHRGIDLSGRGWTIEPASLSRARDGIHGLGGVSFTGGTGASSHIVLAENHAQVEIQYLLQPGGGVLSVHASGQTIAEIDTNAPQKEPGFKTVSLPEGTRSIDLAVEHGPVRMFGVIFTREEPGVIYNSLGLNGASVQMIVRYFEKGQWTEELQHQKPDLVVLNYGTNESIYASYIQQYYAGELREVIRRIHAAVPNASLLIMSPMDRGEKDGSGQIATPAALPRLVEIQRRVAGETGFAFFNTFQAMGGEGTMARWYQSQPRLVSADFMHPLPAGARKVGVLLYQALESGFRVYKAKQLDQLAERASTAGATP